MYTVTPGCCLKSLTKNFKKLYSFSVLIICMPESISTTGTLALFPHTLFTPDQGSDVHNDYLFTQ